ncbi:MAG: helix-turn-helix domain-containing protein [Candidatus Lutacidiplasmatales archaeon]|nr:multiprotein-bridging factor 1 family protein [Thermoplasmata archaeon]
MLCEMCGNDVASTSRVRLEGSVLSLCPECSRFGTLVDPVPAPAPAVETGSRFRPAMPVTRPSGPRRRMEERDLYQEIGEMELAPDWNKRIRVAREALVWTPEDFAKKLNEKKSVVLKIEAGNFRPPDALVRKIEHLLKVRLRAEPEAPGQA